MTVQGGIVEFVKPGIAVTFTAGATITGGNLVKVSASRTVIATAATADPNVAGAALYNAVVGDAITVATDGVWPLVAQGAITFGNDLVSGSVAGTVAALAAASTAVAADINNARNMVGRAYESISNTASGRCKLGGAL